MKGAAPQQAASNQVAEGISVRKPAVERREVLSLLRMNLKVENWRLTRAIVRYSRRISRSVHEHARRLQFGKMRRP